MRIALTGSHCTGKTSLMNKLYGNIEFAGYEFYLEVIREIARIGFNANTDADDSSQMAMCALHILHLKKQNMITDRCLLDNYVYAYMLRDKGANISDKWIETLQYYFLDSINKYDIYAFCPTEFKLVEDGFRMIDKAFQEEISSEILRTLVKYVPGDRYILLSGETDQRVEQLLRFKKAKEMLDGTN